MTNLGKNEKETNSEPPSWPCFFTAFVAVVFGVLAISPSYCTYILKSINPDHKARTDFNRAMLEGQALIDLHQKDKALELFRKAVSARPEDYRGHFSLGNTLVQQSDPLIQSRHRLCALRQHFGEQFVRLFEQLLRRVAKRVKVDHLLSRSDSDSAHHPLLKFF